jgi:hypothetical protein
MHRNAQEIARRPLAKFLRQDYRHPRLSRGASKTSRHNQTGARESQGSSALNFFALLSFASFRFIDPNIFSISVLVDLHSCSQICTEKRAKCSCFIRRDKILCVHLVPGSYRPSRYKRKEGART